MINGFEKFSEKYKEHIDTYENIDGSLVHDVAEGVGKTTSGIGPIKEFTFLAETLVGKENYSSLISCYNTYEKAIKAFGAYQKNDLLYQQTNNEIETLENNLTELNSQCDGLKSKPTDALTNEELEEMISLCKQIKEKRVKIEELRSSLVKPDEGEIVDSMNKLADLKGEIEKILNKEEIVNFKDHHDELCQDFIDMSLLPDEEKSEDAYRTAADGYFTAFKYELDNLVNSAKSSLELINHVATKQFEPLPENMFYDYELSKHLHEMTTTELEVGCAQHFVVSPKMSQAYMHTLEVAVPQGIDKNQYAEDVNNLYGDYSKMGLNEKVKSHDNKKLLDNVYYHAQKYSEILNEKNRLQEADSPYTLI